MKSAAQQGNPADVLQPPLIFVLSEGTEMKIVLALISIIFCMLSSNAFAESPRDLYLRDYEAYFQQWEKKKEKAISCTSPKSTAAFLSEATAMSMNAEVSEANGEVIEDLIMNNPKCFLEGLRNLSVKKQREIITHFVANSIYEHDEEIEKALDSVWTKGHYTKQKQLFEEAKRSR
jgi:hypothetical protein